MGMLIWYLLFYVRCTSLNYNLPSLSFNIPGIVDKAIIPYFDSVSYIQSQSCPVLKEEQIVLQICIYPNLASFVTSCHFLSLAIFKILEADVNLQMATGCKCKLIHRIRSPLDDCVRAWADSHVTFCTLLPVAEYNINACPIKYELLELSIYPYF